MHKEFEQIQAKVTCPLCKQSVNELYLATLDSIIGIRYAYICTKCKNIMKISKEKLTSFTTNNFSIPYHEPQQS